MGPYKVYSYAMAVEEMTRFHEQDIQEYWESFDAFDYEDVDEDWMESLRNSEERRLTEDIPSECHPR